MDIYREKLLDNYNNPQNYGDLADATHECTLENLSCGDSITMRLLIEDEKIKDIKFEGEGCAVAIASASILTDYLKDKPISEVKQMNMDDLLELLGVQLTISRMKCAALSLETTKKALSA